MSVHKYTYVCCRYGPLRNVWVARNPPGFAFVEFEDPRDAEDSVKALDGTYVLPQRLYIYICLTSLTRAKPKEKNEICRSISTRVVKCDGVFFVLQHRFRYGFQHA